MTRDVGTSRVSPDLATSPPSTCRDVSVMELESTWRLVAFLLSSSGGHAGGSHLSVLRAHDGSTTDVRDAETDRDTHTDGQGGRTARRKLHAAECRRSRHSRLGSPAPGRLRGLRSRGRSARPAPPSYPPNEGRGAQPAVRRYARRNYTAGVRRVERSTAPGPGPGRVVASR